MSEVRNRSDNPAPELAHQEIYFPNDLDWGTGVFRFRTKKNMIVPLRKPTPKAICAIALNPPRFQVSAAINPGTGEIPVLLGHADGSNPLSSALFLMPPKCEVSRPHDFEVAFSEWQITCMTMDGQQLMKK
jgi:hypothetical protein